MKLKSIIIDDEHFNLRNLDLIVRENIPEVEVVSLFSNADDAIYFMEKNKVDLVFLDIMMPGKDGFQFLEEFPERKFEVIFVTAYDNFAIKAIKESAIDYILKPILLDELKAAVEKTIARMEEKQKFLNQKITLSFSGGKIFVLPDEIIYIQGIDNICKVYLSDGRTVVLSKTLKHFEDTLQDKFYRAHKSFLVNLSHVQKFSSMEINSIEMSNRTKIPVSRRNLKELKDKMN